MPSILELVKSPPKLYFHKQSLFQLYQSATGISDYAGSIENIQACVPPCLWLSFTREQYTYIHYVLKPVTVVLPRNHPVGRSLASLLFYTPVPGLRVKAFHGW